MDPRTVGTSGSGFSSQPVLLTQCRPGHFLGEPGGKASRESTGGKVTICTPPWLNNQSLFPCLTHTQIGTLFASGNSYLCAITSDNWQAQKWKTDVAEDRSPDLWHSEIALGMGGNPEDCWLPQHRADCQVQSHRGWVWGWVTRKPQLVFW